MRVFDSFLDTLFEMAENVDMSRKHSSLWMALFVVIGVVYLLCGFLAPPPTEALPDLIMILVAWALLVPLVFLLKTRTRRELENSIHLASRDEFMRMESLGDQPPTRFYK